MMAAPRSLTVEPERLIIMRGDLEMGEQQQLDSPANKKNLGTRFPLTRWQFCLVFGVFLIFAIGLFCIYRNMPPLEFGQFKLPRSISDLRILK